MKFAANNCPQLELSHQEILWQYLNLLIFLTCGEFWDFANSQQAVDVTA